MAKFQSFLVKYCFVYFHCRWRGWTTIILGSEKTTYSKVYSARNIESNIKCSKKNVVNICLNLFYKFKSSSYNNKIKLIAFPFKAYPHANGNFFPQVCFYFSPLKTN